MLVALLIVVMGGVVLVAKQNAVVELFYSGTWHDITAAGKVRAAAQISTVQGVPNDGTDGPQSAATAKLTLDNRDGSMNPRNPAGALYGLIGQNTPIRISVGASSEFYGEINTWKPGKTVDWTGPGSARGDAWTDVEAAGVLRRLGKGVTPPQSAMRRAVTYGAVQPVAYWPLEGGDTTTAIAYDAIGDYPTESVDQSLAGAGQSGAASFGTVDIGPGSGKVVNVAGHWTLGMPLPLTGIASTGQAAWQWAQMFGTQVRSGGFINVGFRLNPATADKHLTWQLDINDDGTGHLDVIEANRTLDATAGPTTVGTFSIANMYNGVPRAMELDLTTGTGNNVDFTLYADDTALTFGSYTASFAGAMNAPPYRMSTFTFGIDASAVVGFGHAAVYTDVSVPFRSVPLLGHVGEHAALRFIRLCGELGVACTVFGAEDGQPLGPQRIAAPLDLLAEIERTDGGRIYDSRGFLGLEFRVGTDLLNQAAALTLDYDGHQIAPSLDPVVGDEWIRNDVTAVAPDNTSRRWVKQTGPNNVQPPPAGAGLYNTQINVNPADADTLLQLASWKVARGTFDGIWYASVTADLDAAPSIVAAVNAVKIGDIVTLVGLPADDVPSGTVKHLVLGRSQVVGTHRRTVSLALVPAEPYAVGLLDGGGYGYLDCAGSTVRTTMNTTTATLPVTITDNCAWVHSSGDYDVVVAGEVMTVTAVGAVSGSPGSQTQDLTVARSVNGIAKSHAVGEQVHVLVPFTPYI